jgi:hypothetical protein
MPLLGFKKRYVEPIQLGTKIHTFRAERKHPVKRGDLLYLYCGLRTKNCFRILPNAQPCVRVELMTISRWSVKIAGSIVFAEQCEVLARNDGFSSFAEMMTFFEDRLPINGQLIFWKEPEKLYWKE